MTILCSSCQDVPAAKYKCVTLHSVLHESNQLVKTNQ